jgi:ABC-type multidrug transport system ATPase subunit
MSGDTILQTLGLGKRYGKRWAVRDLDLQVRRGDVFGFLGPNGAGKSTTIRMLLSLITPTAGRIELFGRSLPGHRREVLSRIGGLVERADLYLYLSGRKNLEIVGALKGGVKRSAIDDVLDIVGLSDRGNDRVKTYSHGMKQRLGVAQALLGDPEFIILDEPTTGLDPQGIKEVRELVGRLSRERGITILLSSHLLSEIEQTATSMAIINGGVLAVQGSVSDLLNSSENSVRIEALPVAAAISVLQRFPFVRSCEQRNGYLEVKMPFDRSAEVNAALVAAGVQVAALVPRRSLEEYFLAITEGASDIGPSTHRRKT